MLITDRAAVTAVLYNSGRKPRNAAGINGIIEYRRFVRFPVTAFLLQKTRSILLQIDIFQRFSFILIGYIHIRFIDASGDIPRVFTGNAARIMRSPDRTAGHAVDQDTALPVKSGDAAHIIAALHYTFKAAAYNYTAVITHNAACHHGLARRSHTSLHLKIGDHRRLLCIAEQACIRKRIPDHQTAHRMPLPVEITAESRDGNECAVRKVYILCQIDFFIHRPRIQPAVIGKFLHILRRIQIDFLPLRVFIIVGRHNIVSVLDRSNLRRLLCRRTHYRQHGKHSC